MVCPKRLYSIRVSSFEDAIYVMHQDKYSSIYIINLKDNLTDLRAKFIKNGFDVRLEIIKDVVYIKDYQKLHLTNCYD